jgi:hypothetical protein
LILPLATKAVALQFRSSKLEARNNTKCSRRKLETVFGFGHSSLSLIRACFGFRASIFGFFSLRFPFESFLPFPNSSLFRISCFDIRIFFLRFPFGSFRPFANSGLFRISDFDIRIFPA